VLTSGLIAAGALVFALMRPQVLLDRRLPEYEKQDLIIMLDRSQSMRAHDIRPSRFSRATVEIKNFLEKKPGAIGRVGLVSFANNPVVLSYLTNDTGIIFFYLDWANEETTPQYGTNIGEALNSAMEVAEKDKEPTKKIFLLVSDGEDHGNELDAALATVRSKGYRIHCIGIGSEKEVPIPLIHDSGKETVLTDGHGNVLTTKFDESTLKAIAETTNGLYARSRTGEELTQAINDVVNNESKVIVKWKTSTEPSNLYPIGLAVAGVAGAALWLLL